MEPAVHWVDQAPHVDQMLLAGRTWIAYFNFDYFVPARAQPVNLSYLRSNLVQVDSFRLCILSFRNLAS